MSSSRRRRSEELALLALLSAGVGAAAWLARHWYERERLWRRAREATRGLALQGTHLLHREVASEQHNGHQYQSYRRNGHQNISQDPSL